MKKLAALLTLAIAGAAFAQPYNLRGGFNGWGESPMNDDGDGSWSLTVSAGAPGSLVEFKVAQNDWASSWPGSNVRAAVDGAGNLTAHFFPGPIADGWNPGGDRVGYSDPLQFGWEIQGSFNGWNDGVDTAARQMTNLGNGLYRVDYTIASAGVHDFKFRKSGSWDTSIGPDMGEGSGNIQITTAVPNELLRFELDLPGGRWRVIPEPMTMALVGSGLGLVALRRRARKA